MKSILIICVILSISLSSLANGNFEFNTTKFGCIAYFRINYVDIKGRPIGSFVFSAYGQTCSDAMERAKDDAIDFIDTNK